MSLGSRIATRARVTVKAGLTATPREPLYFLYPQWCRNSSSTAAKPVNEQADSPQDNRTETRAKPISASSLPLEGGPEDRDVQVGSVKGVVAEGESRRLRIRGLAASRGNAPSFEDAKLQAISLPHRNGIEAKFLSKDIPDRESSSYQTAPIPRLIFMVPPVHPLQAVRKLKVLRIRKRHKYFNKSRSDRYHEKRHEKLLEKQNWQKLGLNEDGSPYTQHLGEMLEERPIVGWRDILSDLELHTPTRGPWLEGALKIVIPEHSTQSLVTAIDGHIWEIASTHDCSIKMTEAPSEAGTTFIVSGALISLGSLIADLSLAAPDLQTYAAEQEVPGKTVDLSNEIAWKKNRLRFTISRTARQGISINDLSQPDEWTPESFLDYVQEVLNVTNHVKRTRSKEAPSSGSWQRQMLTRLFEKPECTTSITRAAFHDAMVYFERIHQIRDLRNLFVGISKAELDMTPETFNIMLQGTAKSQNLLSFRFILHLMLRRGYVPNYKTWFAFMESSKDIEVRRHIAKAMKAKGLLGHKSAVKKLVFSVVSQEIETSLDSNEDLEKFVRSMGSRFTSLWLSVATGARILDVLGSRGLISTCWEFVHFMHSKGIHPNTVCINIVLYHCKAQNNLEGILEFLRSLPPTYTYVPDKDTFHGLFKLAWDRRNYNLVRVIWRYACLYGATSFFMRRCLVDSIRNASPWSSSKIKMDLLRPAKPEEARFHQSIGPIVFGRNYDGAHPTGSRIAREALEVTISHPETETSELGYGIDHTLREDVFHDNNEEQNLDEPAWSFNTPDNEEMEPTDEEQPDILDEGEAQETEPTDVDQADALAGCEKQEQAEEQAQNDQAESKPAPTDSALETFDPGFPVEEGSLHENAQPLDKKRAPDKPSILKDLVMLDMKVYQEWRPVKPMSLMLTEAFNKDVEWHKLRLEAKQKGEVETVQQMYDATERMIDDAVSIEIESRDEPRVSTMWT